MKMESLSDVHATTARASRRRRCCCIRRPTDQSRCIDPVIGGDRSEREREGERGRLTQRGEGRGRRHCGKPPPPNNVHVTHQPTNHKAAPSALTPHPADCVCVSTSLYVCGDTLSGPHTVTGLRVQIWFQSLGWDRVWVRTLYSDGLMLGWRSVRVPTNTERPAVRRHVTMTSVTCVCRLLRLVNKIKR